MIGEISISTRGTKMMIVAERNRNDIDVEFLDGHHYIYKHTTYINFKRGQIKNPYEPNIYGVGYFGVGEHVSSINKKETTYYACWKNMIERCYSSTDSHAHKAYYEIAEVCDEWKNFQTFTKWYLEHYYDVDERLHLDKDILYPGNKIYSPFHCLLVPQRINMLFLNKSNKRGLPNGIIKEGNMYYARYNTKELGHANTIEEAYILYAKEKKKKIIETAEEYKNKIPSELYIAMLNYEIRIENDKNYIVGKSK